MDSIKIENFGPIKKADIQLGKLTVLIGEPASGKSTVAKLVAVMNHYNLAVNKNISFLKNYGIDGYFSNMSIIENFNKDFSSRIIARKIETQFVKKFYNDAAEKFRSLGNEIIDIQEEMKKITKGDEWNKMFVLLNSKSAEYHVSVSMFNNTFPQPLYFPTERILLSILSEITFSLNENKINLPFLVNVFGALYEEARNTIRKYDSKVIDFQYNFINSGGRIKFNGAELPLDKSASGIQTLVPLELAIEYLSSEQTNPNKEFLLIIEEPELSLYPIQQKRLLEYLVSKSIQHGDKLILTTHSPYILTAINNLIEADNVIKKRPELKDEVNKIIPEHLQLAFEDVTAYFMNADGTSHSIMDEETRMIDAKAIDVASDEIVGVFDQLLNLEYQK